MMSRYEEKTDPSYQQETLESIAIAKPFSTWAWEKADLGSYYQLTKQLHTRIGHANQSIVNHRLIPVVVFNLENLLRRLEVFNRLFIKALRLPRDTKHSLLGRLSFRFMPVLCLATAIHKYSSGVSRLISKDFCEKYPHKQRLPKNEAALLDFYHAQHALNTHNDIQKSIRAGAKHAHFSAKRAADARHSENREIANRLKAWYIENHANFRSMDAAAEAARKIEPVSFRTARKHIAAAAKENALRAKRKPSGQSVARAR